MAKIGFERYSHKTVNKRNRMGLFWCILLKKAAEFGFLNNLLYLCTRFIKDMPVWKGASATY